ncbi:MAG: hypothetical protein IID33_10855 [Planctomycetes bacterium]|nr:hypothetical protein [Planctomycetota bacterium]
MAGFERQIRTSQHRLWVNRWLHRTAWAMTVAGGVFAMTVLAARLFDVEIPVFWIAIALATVGLLIASVLTFTGRESASAAAARLDEAAGLRERLSSAHFCLTDADPFAQAVVADAEQISGGLSARQHIPLVVPSTFALTAVTFVVAALMFLVPSGLLASSRADQVREKDVALAEAEVAVKRQMDQVRAMLEERPALKDLKEQLEAVDKNVGGKLTRPDDVRHRAAKKIDTLADAIKKKRDSAKYSAARDTPRLLRNLTPAKSPGAPTRKLTQALARGDFKSARKEIKALRELLKTLKSDEDQELVKKISKQLDDLAKQLENAAKSERLAKKLQQAGLDKEQIKRLMEKLSDKDIETIKKMLQKKGLTQTAIAKLAKQLQRQQRAGNAAKKLAQAMKQGAQGAKSGDMSGAMAGLSMAADQLSDLEMAEAEMAQLDSAMASLEQSRGQIDRPCGSCKGRGCGSCGRRGSGMGQRGQGRGGLAPEKRTAVRFKTERGKVRMGRGAIIGQFEFEGEQVKGEVTTEFAELITAAERDASDRINRNRIPRQYQKAVREYFSSVQQSIKRAKTITLSAPAGEDESQAAEPPSARDDGE